MTTPELTWKFAIHTKQVTAWKSQLLDKATDLFEDYRRKRGEGRLAEEEELDKQIGPLKIEVERLNKGLTGSSAERIAVTNEVTRTSARARQKGLPLPPSPPHQLQETRAGATAKTEEALGYGICELRKFLYCRNLGAARQNRMSLKKSGERSLYQHE